MKSSTKLVALAFGILWSLAGQAGDDALRTRLKQQLKKVLPDDEVTSIKSGPVPGLQEVLLGATVLYMSDDGKYVFRGDVFDLGTKENITDARRMEARVTAFNTLDPASTIDFMPKNGKPHATLFVFTDINCGYCRKFHKEVGKLNDAGIAVRYLAFPREGLQSEAYQKAVTVWCSENRQQALTDAKAGNMPAARQCKNPVATEFRLGQSMGVHGTPAVFSQDGEELGGYVPADALIKMLAGG